MGRPLHTRFVMSVLLLLVLGASVLSAALPRPTPPQPVRPTPPVPPKAGGTLVGTLVAKGVEWIAIRPDGTNTTMRYYARWTNGAGPQDGGYERAALDAIHKLTVPCRMRVDWVVLDRPSFTGFTVLPNEQTATLTGVVTAVNAKEWMEITADGQKKAVRYFPRWTGGTPAQGGGLDKSILEAFQKVPVASRVKITWTMQENRPRILTLEVLKLAEQQTTITGVVTAVNPKEWMEVTADGQEKAVRYFPRSLETAAPKDEGEVAEDNGPTKSGGKAVTTSKANNFDPAILEAFQKVPVKSRVKITVIMQDNRPRIVTLEVLKSDEPASNVLTGVVTAVNPTGWIEVKADDQEKAERYYPKLNSDASKPGSPDASVLLAIIQRKVGDRVEITWILNDRKRITKIELVTEETTTETE